MNSHHFDADIVGLTGSQVLRQAAHRQPTPALGKGDEIAIPTSPESSSEQEFPPTSRTTRRRAPRRVVSSESEGAIKSIEFADASDDEDNYSATNPASARGDSPMFEPEESIDPRATLTTSQRSLPTFTTDTPMTDASDATPSSARPLRARDLKNEIEQLMPNLLQQRRTRRNAVQDDPINIMVVNYRVNEHMTWSAIAEYCNAYARKHGLADSLTEAACYSRFTRNGPKVMRTRGEPHFDPKEYMHLKHPRRHPRSEGSSGEEEEEPAPSKKNGNVRQNVAEERVEWNEETERALMESVRHVSDRFWFFVRDEFERQTGLAYAPALLQSHFRAV